MKLRKSPVLIIYSVLAFIFSIQCLQYGSIFSFDIIPIMNKSPLDFFYGKLIPLYGGSLPFNIISTMIPTTIFQNILFFIILSISGYSMHLLISSMTDNKISQFYGGFLYMFNPYTYSRLITGQWLLSYTILPFLIKTFINLLDRKEKKEMVKFILLLSLVSSNIHILIIALIILTIILLIWFNKYRDIKVFKVIIFSAFFYFLLNSYWILPLLSAQNTQIENIGEKDYEAFAPKGGLLDIASMYGFWNEGYLSPKDILPGWQILFLIILSLAIIGFIYYSKDQEIGIYVKAFAVIGILGFILASGVNGPFGDIVRWLFDNTLLKGFRDSHKFVAMMVLAYAVFGGLGIQKIKSEYDDMNMKTLKYLLLAIICISLITPLAYSFTFLNGFTGQIKPTDYPEDWYETNNYINEDKQDFKILFFPWHLYMDFGWVNNTNKRIANPARYFFDKEVISGTNAQIGDLYREVNTPEQVYIDSLLDKRDNITDFGELISILNVKYVILTGESDYKKYFFLFNQTDLELVKQTKNFFIFENKFDVKKIYQTDDIDNIGTEEIGLDYEQSNPVRYDLEENRSKKYIVFTEPYSMEWKLDGKEPLKAYGVVNAFENSGNEIRFERFYRINLPAYFISILAFIGLMAMYPGLEKRKNSN